MKNKKTLPILSILCIILSIIIIILNIIKLINYPTIYSEEMIEEYEEFEEFKVYNCYQTSYTKKYSWNVVVLVRGNSDDIYYALDFKTTMPIRKGNNVILRFQKTKNGDVLVSIVGVKCKKILIKE